MRINSFGTIAGFAPPISTDPEPATAVHTPSVVIAFSVETIDARLSFVISNTVDPE